MYKTEEYYQRLLLLTQGFTIFKNITNHPAWRALRELLEELSSPEPTLSHLFQRYHTFCGMAVEMEWPQCWYNWVLEDKNYFTSLCQSHCPDDIPIEAKQQAARDLTILQEIMGLSAARIKADIAAVIKRNDIGCDSDKRSDGRNLVSLDPFSTENWPEWGGICAVSDESVSVADNRAFSWLEDKKQLLKNRIEATQYWENAVDELAQHYYQVGTGIFASRVAFRWVSSETLLSGIIKPDSITLDQLVGLENELSIILENTEHFLKGYPANNVLLYGDRGTGKSSVVKALLHAYVHRGLRLVELAKSDFQDIPKITKLLTAQRQKFIIFIDDLTFDDNEPEYKALKPVLEGTLEAKAKNILIYATSNRRHLVRENMSERTDDVHVHDCLEEKLSLADRFGITVTFTSPGQEGYLKIVQGLVEQRGLDIQQEELRNLAVRWELWHNGRSGRTASQFVNHLTASQFYQRRGS